MSGWFQPMQFNPAFFIEVAASINIHQQILRLPIKDDGIGCRRKGFLRRSPAVFT